LKDHACFDGSACSVSDPPMPVPIGPASTDTERIEPIVHRDYCLRTGEMESVMKAHKPLKQRALVGARKSIDTLSRPKVMFTLSSSGYCAVHSLVIHNFSIYVFSGSLVFGAIAAIVVTWLSNRLSSSST
jgi:hypothetical protein